MLVLFGAFSKLLQNFHKSQMKMAEGNSIQEDIISKHFRFYLKSTIHLYSIIFGINRCAHRVN